MDLRKARKIICVLLTFVIALGAIISTGTVVFRYTVCRSNYMERFLLSDSIIQQCDKSYNAAIAALEEETQIPARVYQTANEKFINAETAVQRMYGKQDASMYNFDKIEMYEKLCREYLDGNGISYEQEDVRRAAEKAAEIYSDCYGISNAASLTSFISDAVQGSTGRIAFGLLLVFLPLTVILVLFTKKERLLAQLFASVSCAGFSLVLFGIVGLAAGIGRDILITPQIYADAFYSAVCLAYGFIIIVGVAVSVFSVYGALKLHAKQVEKQMTD